MNLLEKQNKKLKSRSSVSGKLKTLIIEQGLKGGNEYLKLVNKEMINENRFYLMDGKRGEEYKKIKVDLLNNLDQNLIKMCEYFIEENELKLKEIYEESKNINLTKAKIIVYIYKVFIKDIEKITNFKEENKEIIKKLEGEDLYIYSLFLAIELYDKNRLIDSGRLLNMIKPHIYYEKIIFIITLIYLSLIYIKLDHKDKYDTLEEMNFYLDRFNFNKDYIYIKFYELDNKNLKYKDKIKDEKLIEKIELEKMLEKRIILKEVIINKIKTIEENNFSKAILSYLNNEEIVIDLTQEERFYLLNLQLRYNAINIEEKLRTFMKELEENKNIRLYEKLLEKLLTNKYIQVKPNEYKLYSLKLIKLKEEINEED